MSRAANELLAAVDLGSNSFHLVVARLQHGQLVVIDRLREGVRLGAGLKNGGDLDRDVAARAIACLERFGQRLRAMQPGSVRVVGTNALRQARSKRAFLSKAREAIGHPIEIIAGVEEARLIYSGVVHTLPPLAGRRLVVDIGGGSTELIIGEDLTPLELESTQMGCVNLSERFFAADRCSRKRLANARLAARLELEPIYQAYRRRGWDESVGSSGTVRSIADVLHELDPAANGISAEGLLQLARRVENYGSLQDLPFESLSGERRSLFGGGLAILLELFDVLGIEHMTVAEGAMREGLLYDMVGRLTDGEDARERTVRAMQGRYHVDMAQSARVEQTAATLLAQVAEPWDLTAPFAAQLLCWAARLHEIGLDVAHAKYHQHGAYLLGNADMPGFPREEQRLLAFLVGNHRRKPNFDGLELLWPDWQERARRLLLLLRLAVLLHRSRAAAALPSVLLEARNDNLTLKFPARWLREHPLTVADLSQEVEYLKARGIRLRVFSTAQSAGSAPTSMAPAA